MRKVEAGLPLTGSFVEFMDLCVQCRGCEAACPSSVPFGRLMEGARETLAAETGYQPWWKRLAYAALGRHRVLVALSRAAAVAQRLHLVPRSVEQRLSMPPLPLTEPPLVATGRDVWFFPGCVMDAWQRSTHAAAIRVMEATGAGVALPHAGSDCCGALHVHAGLTDGARRLAERVMASMPGDAPIVVDSAGCGAALKDYGHLLGTPEAVVFSTRVHDIHEWLAPRMNELPWFPAEARLQFRVAIHDPCHLRHVQQAQQYVRTALSPYVDMVELDDEGLCCGAGGAYSAQHPEMALAIRERKIEAIGRTGAAVVASANPGCTMFLAAAGIDVRHPIDLIDEALNGR
jgi:glycolate oxidase iron-sulfur subunit